MRLPPFITPHPDGITLALKVQPRASVNALGGVHGGELKLKVTAPPVDAAANEAVVRFIADLLDVPRAKVDLVRGRTSRHKVLSVRGVSAEAAARKLGC